VCVVPKAGEPIPHMPSATSTIEDQQQPLSLSSPIYTVLVGDDRRRDRAVTKL
jgi:hypothetical protein